ncbi:MAG: hypothetical protein ACOX0A_09920 [Thermoguttaceae bacterium]|jgi:hypothetical protein
MKYKRFSFLATLCCFSLALSCSRGQTTFDVPTPGEVVVAYEDDLDSGKVKQTVEVFPNEIYFGDTVYFAFYLENLSDSTVNSIGDFNNFDLWRRKLNVVISSPQLKEQYRYRFENPTGVDFFTLAKPLKLEPGEKYCNWKLYLDLCPIEAYDDPFWQEPEKTYRRMASSAR